MMNVNEFFNSLATGTKWSAGVAFTRLNPLPLDDSSVFQSYEAATSYISDGASTAYMGQIIAVVNDTTTTVYVIKADGTLLPLASGGDTQDIAQDLADLAEKVGNPAIEDDPATGIFELIEQLETTLNNTKEDKFVTGQGLTKTTSDSTTTLNIVLDPASDNTITKSAAGLKVTQTDYTIEVETSPTSPNAAKSYVFKQKGSTIATIDIPKDMVVESGTVETYTAETVPEGTELDPGTYIVLTIANATSDKLYIAADSLIEYVTSGSNVEQDMVIITIDPGTHKVTASIRNGSISRDKVDATFEQTLDKADSALQSANIFTGDITTVEPTGTQTVAGSGALKTLATNIGNDYVAKTQIDTSIDSSSVDTNVASAKAVYTAITNAVNNALTITRI